MNFQEFSRIFIKVKEFSRIFAPEAAKPLQMENAPKMAPNLFAQRTLFGDIFRTSTFWCILVSIWLHVGSFGCHFDIILVALEAFWLHIGRSWCHFAPTLTLEHRFPSTIQFADTQFRKTPEHNRKNLHRRNFSFAAGLARSGILPST